MSVPAVRDRLPTPPVAASPAPRAAAAGTDPSSPSPFARLLHGIGHDLKDGESLVRRAIASAGGAELSPAALIALQAGVYRYSEAVDLASRLVDHATTALKTVVQGQ